MRACEPAYHLLDSTHLSHDRAICGEGGEHEARNGLLLRRDIHSLFDAGYVTVDKKLRFVVSDRVKTVFNNGHEYYKLHGRKLTIPDSTAYQPDPTALTWHNHNCFFE